MNLFGNVLISEDEAPNGIEFLALDPNRFRHGQPNRDQGQMILHSNTIMYASQFGIVVEDGLRDLPEYRFYDPDDVVDHAQFTQWRLRAQQRPGAQSARDQPADAGAWRDDHQQRAGV